MSSSLPLLADIRSAYAAGYDVAQRTGEKSVSPIRGTNEHNRIAAAHEDARHRLAEHLGLLCTAICISGEDYVRAFPANLFVPTLTDILRAAHTWQVSESVVVNPFSWDACDSSMPSMTHNANTQPDKDAFKARNKRLSSPSMPCAGMQAASPVEVLGLRALALIAEMVPGGSFALRPSRSKDTLPTLALYLSDPEFLIVNEDLAEELLKCCLYVALVSHDACLEAGVPVRIVELLLVVEPHYLRQLCVQVLSHLIALGRESDLADIWSPVLSLLLESLKTFLLESSLHLHDPAKDAPPSTTKPDHRLTGNSMTLAAITRETTLASVASAGTAAPAASPALSATRTLSAKEATLLQHYVECVAHAIDRFFVNVASMKHHLPLLEQMIGLCVQLLQLSLHIVPATYGEWLRSVAMSPIVALFLANPTFAMPVLLRLRVLEAVCGCMVSLVERREEAGKEAFAAATAEAAESAPAVVAAAGAVPGGESAAGAADPLGGTADASNEVSSSSSSHASLSRPTSPATRGDGASATRRATGTHSSGPVLTTDVTTIPFIADELRLLALLEFLLVLLPCARRGHSHSDYRNTTLPYFRWTWEDDFHNETECNEALSRRLERVYQQTRLFRTRELFAMTHGKQRVFYTDFLSKSYVSERRERHCLHRKPILTGYVHDSQNALLRGCACCASEPAPLFSTWVNRNYMRLRTAETETATTADGNDAAEQSRHAEEGGTRDIAARLSRMSRNTTPPPTDRSAPPSLRAATSTPPPPQPQRRGPLPRGATTGDVRERDVTPSQSVSAQSRVLAAPAAAASGRGRVLHNRDAHEDADNNEDELYSGANGGSAEAQPPSSSGRRRRGLSFWLCGCDSQNTATSVRRSRHVHMPGYFSESPSLPVNHHRSLTVTILPIEAMLEGPGERLQADAATRRAFLGEGVLSSTLATVVPALLSVLDNCVNPVVARHSVTLLLRCLSLCADLRTQVTGEPIELPTSGEAAPTLPTGEAAAKKTRPSVSFRKWITGGGASSPARWQRAEWEAAQSTLHRFVPSLREVLVSLYIAGGVHIVAERQEVFGYLRDDLIMGDELARVGLSTEFSAFQLALPSEQHMCTADAMVLLLGLFPGPKLASPARTLKKAKKQRNAQRPPRPQDGNHSLRGQLSPVMSMSSFEASSHGSPLGQSTPLSAQAPLQCSTHDARSPAMSATTATATPQAAPTAPSRGSAAAAATATLHGSSLSAASPSSMSAQGHLLASHPGSVDSGAGRPAAPRVGPVGGSAAPGGKDAAAYERLCKVVAGGSGGSVFTAHQSTLLLSFARQMVRRSQKVCAAAQQIHESMNNRTFYTRVFIGTPEQAESASGPPQLRSKEVTLRLFPDAGCSYHSTFPACTETFFHASQSLLAALVAAGASPLPVCGSDVAAVRDASSQAGANQVFSCPSAGVTPSMPTSVQRVLSAPLRLTPPPQGGVVSTGATRLADAVSAPRSPADAGAGAPVIPVTVNAAAMQVAIQIAAEDVRGVYRRLPPPLRGLLGFYDYCKTHNVELRAAVVETPELLGELAEQLEGWLTSRSRQREDAEFTAASFMPTPLPPSPSFDTASIQGASGQLSPKHHLRLDSASRGKLLCLMSDFATTIGRDLGLASLDLAPSVVMKQPSSFQKRAKRLKAFGAIRHLVWRPLCLFLDVKAPTSLRQVQYRTAGMTEAPPSDSAAVVVVRRTALPVTTGAQLRNALVSVLPTTTMGQLADTVAALVLVPPAATGGCRARYRPSQPSTSTFTLHATQDQQSSTDSASRLPSSGSPHLTSHHCCEEGGRGDDLTCGSGAAVSADRILFFVNDVPLLSPLTTVLDALTTFSESGASLRELVSVPRRPSDSLDAHNAKVMAAMPALPFWTLAHAVHFVVLAEPLPTSFVLNACTAAASEEGRGGARPLSRSVSVSPSSMASSGCCCCCGCDGMRTAFYCSPKHLFDAAPANGPLALYSVLSTIMRDEVTSAQPVLESNQRRLSSAVVHELYHQLNMFMLPPLLWCSGIGAAARGGGGPGDIASSGAALPASAFPVPSYVLWCYPFIFSAEMRLSIFKFFVSAQRSLSNDQAKHLLQSYRHLLVHRGGAELVRTGTGVAAPSTTSASGGGTADEALKTLDVVGLQWLSEEVLRRHRVTLSVQRHDILRSAEELIRLATCNVTIDVAFEGEAGIGNGPAMEFYELIAEELLAPKCGLWRTESVVVDESEGGDDPLSPSTPPPSRLMKGVALAPLRPGATPRVEAPPPLPQRRPCMPLYPAARQTPASLHRWKLLGVLLGRMLVIGSTTSLCFHPLLLRRLRGESLVSSAAEASRNMAQVDAALEISLKQLELMNAEELAACDLFFTVPASEADGCPSLATLSEEPLLPGGAERQVTVDNVQEYTLRLRTYYLHTVSDVALLQLRQGLQHTVNPLYFQLFTVDELARLLGSSNEDKIWETREQFARNVEAAHGYHGKSDMVQYLLDVVPTWSAPMQHAFLKFVTGSSAVPYGGLTQRIKVVRRDVNIAGAGDSSASPVATSFANSGAGGSMAAALGTSASFALNGTNHDNTLPTVSTCFLYLKLPQYSSKAVLQERLRFAVLEGQSFFSLT